MLPGTPACAHMWFTSLSGADAGDGEVMELYHQHQSGVQDGSGASARRQLQHRPPDSPSGQVGAECPDLIELTARGRTEGPGLSHPLPGHLKGHTPKHHVSRLTLPARPGTSPWIWADVLLSMDRQILSAPEPPQSSLLHTCPDSVQVLGITGKANHPGPFTAYRYRLKTGKPYG